jgi:hypothetical protein
LVDNLVGKMVGLMVEWMGVRKDEKMVVPMVEMMV